MEDSSGALIVTGATKKGLGARMNESASSGPSSWAQKMLAKHGWKEGEGLGREKQGMTSHIKIAKKDDALGVGAKVTEHDNFGHQWWFQAYGGGASKPIGGAAAVTRDALSDSSDSDDSDSDAAVGSKRKSAAKSRKCAAKRARDGSSSDSDSDSPRAAAGGAGSASAAGGSGTVIAGGVVIPSFEELFKATGGARLGMRARREQPGKWARAEAAAAALAAKRKAVADGSSASSFAKAKDDNESEESRSKDKGGKKDKKEKKAKKDTKELCKEAQDDSDRITKDDKKSKKDKKEKKEKKDRD